MHKIDETAVIRLYDHYHQTIKSKPQLYRTNDVTITVVLPKDLLEFSNASAGHSGFGAGARPVGIRRSVPDSTRALQQIFSTPDSLMEFILQSECDGPAHVEAVRKKHASAAPKKAAGIKVNQMASQVFWTIYGKDTMQALITKYTRPTVEQAFKTLTLPEFEARFELRRAA